MASENELKIILSLVDEASGKLKESLGEVNQEAGKAGAATKDFGDKSGEANKKASDGFKESASQARTFRKDVMLVISSLVMLINSVRTYAQYNKDARDSVNSIELSFQKLSYSVGEAVTKLGILKVLQQSMKGWAMIGDVLTGHPEKITEDNSQITQQELAKQEIAEVNQQLRISKELYQTGRITADEYYLAITDGENNSFLLRQQEMQQMNEIARLSVEANNAELMGTQQVIDIMRQKQELARQIADASNQQFMEEQRQTQEQISAVQAYVANWNQAHASVRAGALSMAQAIKTNLSTALSDIILGAKNAKEAFKAFGEAMLKAIVDYIVQQGVSFAMSIAFASLIKQQAMATGAAVASAWANAAALVSLATLGANAAPATAAIIGVNALAEGMAMSSGRSIDVTVQSSAGATAGPAAMAYGGDNLVTRPTLFLAGENGPERAIFQPAGGGGGGGSTTINIYSPIVSSRDGIQELADVISERLNRETERI
jgi:hypothetical protein